MEAEAQRTTGEALRAIYAFVSPRRRRELWGVLVFMLLGAFAEIAAIASVLPFVALLANERLPQSMAWMSALLSAVGGSSPRDQVLLAAAAFITLACVAGAIRLLLIWVTQRFIQRLGDDLGVEVQRRILLQPYSYHIEQNSSSVLAAIEMVDLLVTGVLLQIMYAVTALLIALFIVAILMRVDVLSATIAAIGIGSLYLLVSSVTATRLKRNSRISAAAFRDRLQTAQESLGGIRDVIIDSSQAICLDAFRRANRRLADARASTLFIGAAPRPAIESGGMVLVALVALLLWNREGSLGPALPVLGALAVGAFRLLPFLQQLYLSWTAVQGNRAIADRVVGFLELPTPVVEDSSAVTPLQFDREIRFDDVSFRYAGARRPALRDVDVVIPCGSRVALVGRTGAGKSTFADLLMGLLRPTAGTISIDGVPLSAQNEQAWRASIAHVPQSVFLADTSIARNIAFNVAEEAIDRGRVEQAARVAQLDDLLHSLPEGVDTRIGERGIRLSGGQRQRIGIARALYKGARLLVLDEATNALDSDTEAALMHALLEEAGTGRTVVIISHRPTAIAACDLIIRLENGTVADCVRSDPADFSARAIVGQA